MTQQSNGEKLTNALKDETLMKKVGQLASDEQKSTMTQSTVEERFDYEFPNGQVMDIGPESNGISWHLSKRQRQALKNFIKSELQLAEQKTREEGFNEGAIHQDNLWKANLPKLSELTEDK
jgi:hypothetical protein